MASVPEPLVLGPPIIDIEASGFGAGSYPIEIGFVLSDGRSDCMLIHPMPNWRHWDPAAENLHHISRAALLTHGRPVADVAERLNAQLRGMTLYTDGWGNDFSWLAVLFDAARRRPNFRLESVVKLLSEDQLSRWNAVKQVVFGEAARERHRASADARLLQATFVRLNEPPA